MVEGQTPPVGVIGGLGDSREDIFHGLFDGLELAWGELELEMAEPGGLSLLPVPEMGWQILLADGGEGLKALDGIGEEVLDLPGREAFEDLAHELGAEAEVVLAFDPVEGLGVVEVQDDTGGLGIAEFMEGFEELIAGDDLESPFREGPLTTRFSTRPNRRMLAWRRAIILSSMRLGFQGAGLRFSIGIFTMCITIDSFHDLFSIAFFHGLSFWDRGARGRGAGVSRKGPRNKEIKVAVLGGLGDEGDLHPVGGEVGEGTGAEGVGEGAGVVWGLPSPKS